MSISLLIKGVGVFWAMTALAIILETPKKYLIHTGMIGALSGLAYMLGVEYGCSVVLSSFLSAFFAAFMSNLCARIYKTPVTLFLVIGILPMVPGAGMYYTVHYLLEGEQKLASHYMLETIEVAGVIALAVFVADSIFRAFSRMQNNMERNAVKNAQEEKREEEKKEENREENREENKEAEDEPEKLEVKGGMC